MSTTPESASETVATEPVTEAVVTETTDPGPAAVESGVESGVESEQETVASETTAADSPTENTATEPEETSGHGRSKTDQLVREGEIAADFLEGLLDIADLSGDLEVDIEGNRAAIAIVDSEDGPAPRRLVGPGGQVLDALQELTRLAVQAETGERSRLMLDVAGYRSDRRSALVRAARGAIEDVRASGERRELEPMTAFERKVIHDEVLAAGLVSESEGVEPSRYVVILPSA